MLFWKDFGLDINVCFKNWSGISYVICSWSYLLAHEKGSRWWGWFHGQLPKSWQNACVPSFRSQRTREGEVTWPYRTYGEHRRQKSSHLELGLLSKHKNMRVALKSTFKRRHIWRCMFVNPVLGRCRQPGRGGSLPIQLACFVSYRSWRHPNSEDKVGRSWNTASKIDRCTLPIPELTYMSTAPSHPYRRMHKIF